MPCRCGNHCSSADGERICGRHQNRASGSLGHTQAVATSRLNSSKPRNSDSGAAEPPTSMRMPGIKSYLAGLARSVCNDSQIVGTAGHSNLPFTLVQVEQRVRVEMRPRELYLLGADKVEMNGRPRRWRGTSTARPGSTVSVPETLIPPGGRHSNAARSSGANRRHLGFPVVPGVAHATGRIFVQPRHI